MTTINNIADLARILRENPEWAESIRSLVLSRELLELPERFAQLANRVDELAARLDVLTARVDALTARVDDLTIRFAEFVETTNRNFELVNRRLDNLELSVARLETSVNQVNGRLDNGLGMNYELKVGKNLGSIASQHLNLRRVRALKATNGGIAPEFMDLLEDAEDQGRINREQFESIQRLDLVFRGQRRGESTPTLVAAELSISIGDNDIVRATERGTLLAQAAQMPVVPAVVGARIDEERNTLAEANGVAVILFPDE